MKPICVKIDNATEEDVRRVYDILEGMSSPERSDNFEEWRSFGCRYLGINKSGFVRFWNTTFMYEAPGYEPEVYESPEEFFEYYDRDPNRDSEAIQMFQDVIDTAQEEEERMLVERLFVVFAQNEGPYADPETSVEAAKKWAKAFYSKGMEAK